MYSYEDIFKANEVEDDGYFYIWCNKLLNWVDDKISFLPDGLSYILVIIFLIILFLVPYYIASLIATNSAHYFVTYMICGFIVMWYYFSKVKLELASLKMMIQFKERYKEEILIYLYLLEVFNPYTKDDYIELIKKKSNHVDINILLSLKRIHDNQKNDTLNPFFNKLYNDYGNRFSRYSKKSDDISKL